MHGQYLYSLDLPKSAFAQYYRRSVYVDDRVVIFVLMRTGDDVRAAFRHIEAYYGFVKGVGDFERLGTTIDDAAGEAFDKVAKMLNLGYPGGPMIEKMASVGNPDRFILPRPLQNSGDCNLSFSGLKTAVRKIIESYSPDGKIEHAIMRKRDAADICAAFQNAATDCLRRKLEKAIAYFKANYPEGKDLVVSGGVAANSFLRQSLQQLADKHHLVFSAPPIKFCTDNGVMIAWAGLERFQQGYTNNLDFKPRPRWPLDENAPKAAGAGGVKA